ncbi:mitochondrial ribosomal protein S29 precursor, putative [Hepatocystis sp. ex Piliocolobus tephrosceles]|nr:mitochondrial ribosomal protein S29 precursor, putative [Hepatocystis sp. ex Piliocolobus tephrosceles]
MKILLRYRRHINTYNIPSISNSTRVHRIYRDANKRKEDDLLKIYNKELVAFPYNENQYNELLNINVDKNKCRNIGDFFFNSNIYMNIQNEKIQHITSADFDLKNIEKIFLFKKEYLDKYFPEGLAGELNKDILMQNDDITTNDNLELFLMEQKKNNKSYNQKQIDFFQNMQGIGILYRKLTHEIINELKHSVENFKISKLRDSYSLDRYFLQSSDTSPFFDNREDNLGLENQSDTKHKENNYNYKSRSILLDGKRGTGKSCILNSVVLWAKLNNWFVIFVPNIKKYKFDINTIVRSNTNLYIQPQLSKQFLEDIVKVNEHFLKEMKVNKDILNNTCLDGTHLLYNKRIYNDIIKKTVETEILNDEQNYNTLNERDKNMYKQKLYKFYYDNIKIPNILNKFALPDNLLDLANIGINHTAYANLCIYAIFEHLKKQTKFPILIAIDQFNYNLSVSEYLSINFEYTKYNGYIPTYYFTIPKLLIQWNASQYKRCFKIVATCWDRDNRRNFLPELLQINKKEIKTVRNYTLREFKNYVCHLANQNIIYNFDINKLEYFYMLTGGNGFQARKLLTTLY